MSDKPTLNEQLKGLLAKCATGDEAALSELYHLTAPNLLAVQSRILGMNSMAERALHDTYSRIWLKAPEYTESMGEPVPWLTSIARNHALNLKRARRDTNDAEMVMDETAELNAEFTDLGFLANHEGAAGVKAVLDDMDKHASDGIVRAYLDGRSLKELSDSYNIPMERLHDSIHEGMRALGSAS